jgi:hypothetical protein
MYSRLVVALYAFLLMTSYGQAGTRLSADEIRALAPGDYVGTWKAKRNLHLTLNTNGTVSGSLDGYRYKGNWYVSGQSLCVAFKVMAIGKTKCGDIRRKGAWLVGYNNKKGQPRIRIRATSGTLNVANVN